MSLQVWLPLNGDLHNQGLSNVTLTASGSPTIDTAGKIGSCYNFDGNSYFSSTESTFLSNMTECSLSCWVKDTYTGSSWMRIFGIGSHDRVHFDTDTTGKVRFFVSKNGTSSSYWSCISKTAINDSTWHHLCGTFNSTQCKIYIDGICETTITTDALPSVTGGKLYLGHIYNGIKLNGSLNDVRIYNHCLSPKEVEEISKGLVLHYKLDQVINNKIYDCSGYGYNGTVIGAYTLEDTSPRYSYGIYMNNSGTANRIESDVEIAIPEDTLSVSFWTKFDKSKAMVIFADPKIEFAKNANASVWLTKTSMKGFTLASFNTNEWNHIVVIHDGETYKLYINGVSVAQNASANNWTHNSTKLYLFNRSYNNNYAATASISDFRMYATVLSDKQILELYKNSGSIDNIKNVYARELVEV